MDRASYERHLQALIEAERYAVLVLKTSEALADSEFRALVGRNPHLCHGFFQLIWLIASSERKLSILLKWSGQFLPAQTGRRFSVGPVCGQTVADLAMKLGWQITFAIERATGIPLDDMPLDTDICEVKELTAQQRRGIDQCLEKIGEFETDAMVQSLREEVAAAKRALAVTFSQTSKASTETNPVGNQSSNDPQSVKFTLLERAIMLLRRHPDWSDSEIAKAVPVHKQTIYKPNWATYRMARKLLRQVDPPRGVKDSETGEIEAWADDE